MHRLAAALLCAVAGTILADAVSAASTATVVWKAGDPRLGRYKLPSAGDGQCPGAGPSIAGSTVTFQLFRNTRGAYEYGGRKDRPGASTCWRNQIDPIDPSTGHNFLLAMGAHYTFTFRTIVRLNGNTAYRHLPGGRLAIDLPAIVWQTHSYGGSGSPCDELVISNTVRAATDGSAQYGSPAEPGAPVWNFHTCDDTAASGDYFSPDTVHDGEADDWTIDVVARIQGQPNGSIVVRRNGRTVYARPTHVCDASTPECFWNFGPYMFFWPHSEPPPGWNGAGIAVTFEDMTLVKHG
jgi:hypothetical protein